MSIIDDARGEAEECPYAPEVVRLHDEFSALADKLEQEVEDALRKDIKGDVAVLMGIQTSTKRQVATRIREVIERGKS